MLYLQLKIKIKNKKIKQKLRKKNKKKCLFKRECRRKEKKESVEEVSKFWYMLRTHTTESHT